MNKCSINKSIAKISITECYNCESTSQLPYLDENGFSLVKCANCGLLYVNNPPAPDVVEESTQRGVHQGDHSLQVTGRFNSETVARMSVILTEVFGHCEPPMGRWLDVGCGHGELLMAGMKTFGARVQFLGVEPNTGKVLSAKSRNLDVTQGSIEAANGNFEVISLMDVYSHLVHPPSFLQALSSKLSPGGLLLLQTGDSADFSAHETLKPVCLPDHLSFASERILRAMLAKMDYEVVTVKKYPYLYRDAKTMAKEVIKLVVPGKRSYLRYYLNWRKYSQQNMFILARKRAA